MGKKKKQKQNELAALFSSEQLGKLLAQPLFSRKQDQRREAAPPFTLEEKYSSGCHQTLSAGAVLAAR